MAKPVESTHLNELGIGSFPARPALLREEGANNLTDTFEIHVQSLVFFFHIRVSVRCCLYGPQGQQNRKPVGVIASMQVGEGDILCRYLNPAYKRG